VKNLRNVKNVKNQENFWPRKIKKFCPFYDPKNDPLFDQKFGPPESIRKLKGNAYILGQNSIFR